MKAWANILFLLFVVFLGMFMTHIAIRHERLRETFRGGGGVAISRAGGTANSPLDGSSLESFNNEGFRNSGGIGGVGGYAGGGLGDGDISSGMGGGGAHGGGSLNGGRIYNSIDNVEKDCGSYPRRYLASVMDNGSIKYICGCIQAPAHKGHYNFEHCEDHGRYGWHESIEQPHHYPGGGAMITRNWMGVGKGNGWFGYGWPFVWWGPAWYPEYAYICNKDSDCAVGKCGTSGFCVV
jgi:hypothetical protein